MRVIVLWIAGMRIIPMTFFCISGHKVPIPHFGVVLEWQTFHSFVERMKARDIKFEVSGPKKKRKKRRNERDGKAIHHRSENISASFLDPLSILN
jgi:extradiol dioxygenase family protein